VENNKFIAMLMGRDEIDFREEFLALPMEEQESFINFFADLMAFGMRQMIEMPIDIRAETFVTAIGALPPGYVQEVSEVMQRYAEEGE
jgi:hypothetical protein